ncbi:MAG: DUF4430 domain-containing protein [Ruminococcus sp.]|nr:DUF4430 domain-containing protein [Ruminococcus sp.]
MSEKLSKLIKPAIAVLVIAAVLLIAYFSGGDVSVPVSEDSRAETTTVTAATAATQTTPVTTLTETDAKQTTSTEQTTTRRTTTSKTAVTSRTTNPQTTPAAAPTTTSATVTTTVTTTTTPEVTAPPEPEFAHKCTLLISCATIFDNTDKVRAGVLEEQPAGGIIFPRTEVGFDDGESIFDIVKRICDRNDIRLEFTKIAATNSYYIEGINNLYEFDAGNLSGWMYSVNGHFPQLSCSQYKPSEGDVIEFVYSCNIGVDVGDDYFAKAG